MTHITYQELVERCGQKLAYELLRVVEKDSGMGSERVSPLDCSERFQRALYMMLNQTLAA